MYIIYIYIYFFLFFLCQSPLRPLAPTCCPHTKTQQWRDAINCSVHDGGDEIFILRFGEFTLRHYILRIVCIENCLHWTYIYIYRFDLYNVSKHLSHLTICLFQEKTPRLSIWFSIRDQVCICTISSLSSNAKAPTIHLGAIEGCHFAAPIDVP